MPPSAPIGQSMTLDYLVPGSVPPPNGAPSGLSHILRFDVVAGVVSNLPPVGGNLVLAFDIPG